MLCGGRWEERTLETRRKVGQGLWGGGEGVEGRMERRSLAWGRAVGRDSVTWAVAGGEKRIQDEAQVPVTGDRVGGGAVPEIGVGFIYSFFMHSFIKKKKRILSLCCVPGSVPGLGYTSVNKTDRYP